MDSASFLEQLAQALGTDPRTTDNLLNGLINVIGAKAADQDLVVIPGLGEFQPSLQNPQPMLDPATGRAMMRPQCMKITFSASATLKKRLANE